MSAYELCEFGGCPNLTGGACDARKNHQLAYYGQKSSFTSHAV